MSEWTKPGSATAVSVQLVIEIPSTGIAADSVARALATCTDADGAVVFKRGVGNAAVKALLTAQQKTQLAGIMTTLHGAAVAQLLNS